MVKTLHFLDVKLLIYFHLYLRQISFRGKKKQSEKVLHQVWLNWNVEDELPEQEFAPITSSRGFSCTAATPINGNQGQIWMTVIRHCEEKFMRWAESR